MQTVVSRHRFRRLAQFKERQLEAWNPDGNFKVIQLTPGQRDFWGNRWAVVRTK